MRIIITQDFSDFLPTTEANFVTFNVVEYKQYSELVELCKNNGLTMIVNFGEEEEE